MRLGNDGSKLWEISLGGSANDQASGIPVPLPDGRILVGGRAESGVSGNKTSPFYGVGDGWLAMLTADSIKLWDRTYGGNGDDAINGVCVAEDGTIMLGLTTSSGPSGNKTSPYFGNYDYWVVWTDQIGNKIGETAFGGNDLDYATCLVQTGYREYVIGGYSASSPSGTKSSINYGGNDFWLVKFNMSEIPIGSPQVYVATVQDGISNRVFANGMTNLVFASTNTVLVELASSFTNGIIWFTTDGSDPVTSGTSQWYDDPFVISNSLVLRVIAWMEDFSLSVEADPR
jgi:hypothetical protein